jgi:histidine triad (HIT) family protein
MATCIFCEIVAGRAAASFVHRDELVSAFLDIRPVTPGHLLVVPNEHAVSISDVPDATAHRMFDLGRRLARTIASAGVVRAEGVNLFVADGAAAGQDVFHAHLHAIPRFAGDGFTLDAAAWGRPAPTRDELDRIADALRRDERVSE